MAAFEIDGREYQIPPVFDLTMGEAQVLYDYSGYALEDFVPPIPGEEDDRMAKLRNPAFKRAMVHIAYQRGNPELARPEVAALVDGFDMYEMVAAMYATDDDADPTLASQNEPPSSSGNVTPLTPENTGRYSPANSGLPDGIRAFTGTTG